MHRFPSTIVTALLVTAGLLPVAVAAPAGAAPRPDPVVTARGQGAADAHRGTSVERPDQVRFMSVRGAGPFRIGARFDRLSEAGLIAWTAPGCTGVLRAGVDGAWAGTLILSFQGGRLVGIGTATAPPRSPRGGAVGMSFAALEEIYGPRGAMIRDDAGTRSAYLVRVGSRVELYTDHPIRPGVGYFEVGVASFVERSFRQGDC